MNNSSHLVERAAERLIEVGGVPGYGGANPSPASIRSRPASEPLAPPSPPAVGQEALRAAGLIAESAVRTRISEEMWLIQRQVLRLAFGANPAAPTCPNLVMVCSARPGEGKSFTALNLAASVARQGDHPVLLVDADVKAQSLSALMGQHDAPGLLDLLDDPGLDAAAGTLTTAVPGLSFLPTGRARPRSSELLSSRQAGRLLHALARRNPERLVVIDTPPCLATGDAAAIAPAVGQILFVVEAEHTQRREVENALDLLQECRSITLLLNKVQHPASGQGFGAYAPYYAS